MKLVKNSYPFNPPAEPDPKFVVLNVKKKEFLKEIRSAYRQASVAFLVFVVGQIYQNKLSFVKNQFTYIYTL